MFYFVVNNFRPAKLYSDQQKIPVQNRTTAHIVLRTVVLVDPSRLELETTEPKSAVLPLHHGSMERGKDNNISRQSKIACSTFLQCRLNKQVQNYDNNSKNICFGEQNPNLRLGL